MKKNSRDENRGRGKRGLENWRALGFFYKIDGLSLFKEGFGQTFTYDKDNNIVAVTDLQDQK